MFIFTKVKNILEKEDTCVISKGGEKKYVVVRWNKWNDIANDLKELKEIRSKNNSCDDEEDDYSIDINQIPV